MPGAAASLPPIAASAPTGVAFSCMRADRPACVVWRLADGRGLSAHADSTFRVERDASGVVRSRWLDAASGDDRAPPAPFAHDPLTDLDRLVRAHGVGPEREPFASGWIGWVSYDLGELIEPASVGAGSAAGADATPLMELHRFTSARRWEAGAGEPAAAVGGRGVVCSVSGRASYVRAVGRVLEHIRAGDVYQVNLAHALRGRFSGSTRDLYSALAASAEPAHGVYVESAPGPVRWAVLSLSPESFLTYDPATRRVETRPMKGTRPGVADPAELMHAEKDRAELAMIVDLMRNDLGRVCEFGSVRVVAPRRIERHGSAAGGVLQATATVSGRLREGLELSDLLRACFPPGSVTGAPKIRAMRIIGELEGFRRGPYCGATILVDDAGRAQLGVAIRTAVVCGRGSGPGVFEDAAFEYAVGAGIVADSDPEAEWRETLDKAGVVRGAFEIGDAP